MINPFNRVNQFKKRAQKYRDDYDKQELDFVLDFLKSGDTVLDIGAHRGVYSYWMSRIVGDQGKIICIEPQSSLVKYMKHIFLKLGLGNIEVLNYAVSNRTGAGHITIPRVYGKTSQLTKIDYDDGVKGVSHKRKVEFITLDNLVKKLEIQPKLIKIDVEGGELKLFEGAGNTLSQMRPLLIFECEQRHLTSNSVFDVFEFLQKYNYKGSFFDGKSIHAIEQFELDRHQISPLNGDKTMDKFYVNNFIFEPA